MKPRDRPYTHARRFATLRDLAERLQPVFPHLNTKELEAILHTSFELMGNVLLEYGRVRCGNSAVVSLTRKVDAGGSRCLKNHKGPRRAGTYRATVHALPAWKEKYTEFEQGIESGRTTNWDQLRATPWSRDQQRVSALVRDLRARALLEKWATLMEPQRRGDIMDKYAVDQDLDGEEMEKAAASGCPDCGATVEQHGNVVSCPRCGTAPFEKRKKRE